MPDRVFIRDLAQLQEFLKLARAKEEYFDHVMDKAIRGAKARI
jgi:hypothetical protein